MACARVLASPATPSGTHSPRRAPRNPVRDAQIALHNSCYLKVGGGECAFCAFFLRVAGFVHRVRGRPGGVRLAVPVVRPRCGIVGGKLNEALRAAGSILVAN